MRRHRYAFRMHLVSLLVFTLLLALIFISFQAQSVLAAPGNDNFDDATSISSLAYHDEVSSEDMTVETDEVESGCLGTPTVGSVWWEFTPTATEEYQIDTTGSEFPAHDTVLSVYTNPSSGGVDSLDDKACNDDDVNGGIHSLLTMTLVGGETYYIRVALYGSGPVPAGTIHLNVDFAPTAAAANDDLADAINIGTLPFNVTADTTGMGIEPDELVETCGVSTVGSLWWKITPSVTGIYVINTLGSTAPSNDTVLSIYKDDDDNGHPLTDDVDCDDDGDGAPNNNSALMLMLYKDETYYIRVAIYEGLEGIPSGTVNLNVDFLGAVVAGNDDLAFATIIDANDLPYSDIVNAIGMTLEPGEVQPTCMTFTDGSMWWEFTAPASGDFLFNTEGSTAPANDTVLSIHTDIDPFDGINHPLDEEDCDNDGGPDNTSVVTAELTAGETYYIRIAHVDEGSGAPTGVVQLNVISLIGTPGNDDIGDAFSVTSLPFTQISFLSGSTIELNEATETDCQADTIGSVWWVFTPPANGFYTIDTVGSTLISGDTVLSIYEFGTTHPLIEIDCNDDIDFDNDNYLSRLAIELESTETYLIRVAEYGTGPNSAGSVRLNVAATTGPANDDVANAFPVTSLPFTDSVNTAGTTTEPGEIGVYGGDDCDGIGTLGSVWWVFTPLVSGDYQIDTFGSADPANDTVLSVYTDPDPSPGVAHPLNQVACADQGGPEDNSYLFVTLISGTTYYIRIADYDGGGLDVGTVVLNVTSLSAPGSNDDLADAIVIPPFPDFYTVTTNTTGMTEETGLGEVDPTCAPTEGSLWWSFTPDESGFYGIDTADTPGSSPALNTVISVYTDPDPTPGGTYPLDMIACNDDALPIPGIGFSALALNLTEGVEYFIRVADFDDVTSASSDGLDTGTIVIYVTFLGPAPEPPPNDDFVDAIPLTTSLVDYDITGATIETDEDLASCGNGFIYGPPFEAGSVWWTFVPDDTGYYEFNTYNSIWNYSNDTVLTIYSGSELDALTELKCDEDNNAASGDLNAFVQVELTEGETYYVRVGIYDCTCIGFPVGSIDLNVMFLGSSFNEVYLSTNTVLLDEGGGPGILTFIRDGDASEPLTITFGAFSASIETTPDDFEFDHSSLVEVFPGEYELTFAADESAIDLQITAVDDTIAEPVNTFEIYLISSLDYIVVAPDTATATISRNDTGVTHGDDSGFFVEGSIRLAIENNELFDSNSTITLPPFTDFALESPLEITESVVIAGDTSQSFYPCGCGGGALFIIEGGTVRLYGFTITGGTAGGVSVTGGNVTLGNDPLIITGNSSTTCGGGLYVGPGASVTLQEGSQVTLNDTTDNGGGICVNDGSLTVIGLPGDPSLSTLIEDNYADGNGGGIYQTGSSSSVTIYSQPSISYNEAASGGGIYQENGSLSVTDTLIQNNIAGSSGAVRFSASAFDNSSVTNSCIAGNSDTDPTVSYNGGIGVNATTNWWGSPAGPYTSGVSTPNPPNNDDTAYSTGDSVTVITDDPPDFTIFDYSGYLTSPPLTGCLVCAEVSSEGGGGVCT